MLKTHVWPLLAVTHSRFPLAVTLARNDYTLRMANAHNAFNLKMLPTAQQLWCSNHRHRNCYHTGLEDCKLCRTLHTGGPSLWTPDNELAEVTDILYLAIFNLKTTESNIAKGSSKTNPQSIREGTL